MEYKIAVICKYRLDYISYLKTFKLDSSKYIHIREWKDCLGRYYGGIVKWYRYHEIADWKEIEFYIEQNLKRSVQQCLDYLDEKQKVLNWLISGYGQHIYKIKALRYMTKEFIVMYYSTEPDYFNNGKLAMYS